MKQFWLGATSVCCALLGMTRTSAALDTGLQVAGQPLNVAATDVTSVVINGNNRNSRGGDIASELDDDWSLVHHRLYLQSSNLSPALPLRFSLRLDTALFPWSRSPVGVALALTDRARSGPGYSAADADYFRTKLSQGGTDLASRFVSWTYPAKWQLSYHGQRGAVTVGDFSEQFGRGLVLSVRKNDELQGDTSIRGIRLRGHVDFHPTDSPLRASATVLGGTLNPLRLDPSSGRILGTTPSVLRGLGPVTEFGMPRAIATDFGPAAPNFAPDSVFGGEVSLSHAGRSLSFAAIQLRRPCVRAGETCHSLAADRVRAAPSITQGSAALDLPTLPDSALYVEAAWQQLEARSGTRNPKMGYAAYGSLNTELGSVALTLEAKHYRAFFPLRASVDLGRAREFSQLQYSTPPTTEPVWNDTEFEGFNTCVSGGRAKADYHFSRRHSAFAWLAHYRTWAESSAADDCRITRENENAVWDAAQGVSLSSRNNGLTATTSVGTRFDDTARALAGFGAGSHVFYREVYTRYDLGARLGNGVSLQLLGLARRRRQTLGGPTAPWWQGQNSLALRLGNAWWMAAGFDYTQNPAFPPTYVNGQLKYSLSTADSIALFAGQRQGGLRCVSGVCRVFPPFEGARLEATFRF